MKTWLSLLLLLLAAPSIVGERFFYRVKTDTPHNLHFAFGTSLFAAKTMPISMTMNCSVDLNIFKIASFNYFQTFLPYAAPEYDGFYLLGKKQSDYEYGEFRIGASIHLSDTLFKKQTPIIISLSQRVSSFTPIQVRDILAVRTGYDRMKGRATFTGLLEYPIVTESVYAGFSWTRIQTYETWAVQYGTPGAHRRFQVLFDILFMPDDSTITGYGGDVQQLGFRLGFQARSTIFSLLVETGIRPGLKKSAFFSLGVGGRFSLLVKPLYRQERVKPLSMPQVRKTTDENLESAPSF